jgi:hypothetical protein
MWLRNLSRDGNARRGALSLGGVAAVTLALALSGCSANYVENDAASVLLLIQTIADGSPVLSDVRAGASGDSIVNCQVTATVLARPKNPTSVVGLSEDVRLTRYDVSYRRSDGRGVQGVDVPYTISGNMTAMVQAGSDTSTDLTIDLVRHQAKLEPPLSNISGLQIVTMFADVTISGETISGKAVTAKGSAQVTFADFADGTTTCEGS